MRRGRIVTWLVVANLGLWAGNVYVTSVIFGSFGAGA